MAEQYGFRRTAWTVLGLSIALASGCHSAAQRDNTAARSQHAAASGPAQVPPPHAEPEARASAAPPNAVGTADESRPAESSPLTALDNFYPIVDGRAYRSAQVRTETLEYAARRYGLKTVVNLRGPNPHAEWYRQEKADCDRLGLRMIDVRLSASELPRPESLLALVEALKPENEPLLMHCRGGADRSGMAAALWRRLQLGEDAETAGGQLSFLYGHFRRVHPEMFDMVKMFEPTRSWIEQQFPALREQYERRKKPSADRGDDD